MKKRNLTSLLPKVIMYISCLCIIILSLKIGLESKELSIINPVLRVDSLILRCVVVTSILTCAGFGLVKYIMIPKEFKCKVTEKYLSILFFLFGILCLFLPIAINTIMVWFILSAISFMLYLFKNFKPIKQSK